MKLLLETWKRFVETTILDEKFDPTTIKRAIDKFKKDPTSEGETEENIQKRTKNIIKYIEKPDMKILEQNAKAFSNEEIEEEEIEPEEEETVTMDESEVKEYGSDENSDVVDEVLDEE